MDNKTLILKEFEKLKGQFVITTNFDIERLVGIGEDEYDYYYITYNGRKLSFHSCVGRIMPLKGRLDKDDYDYLIRIAELNHYDKLLKKSDIQFSMDAFKQELMKDWRDSDKLLTDLIFDDESSN